MHQKHHFLLAEPAVGMGFHILTVVGAEEQEVEVIEAGER